MWMNKIFGYRKIKMALSDDGITVRFEIEYTDEERTELMKSLGSRPPSHCNYSLTLPSSLTVEDLMKIMEDGPYGSQRLEYLSVYFPDPTALLSQFDFSKPIVLGANPLCYLRDKEAGRRLIEVGDLLTQSEAKIKRLQDEIIQTRRLASPLHKEYKCLRKLAYGAKGTYFPRHMSLAEWTQKQLSEERPEK